MKRLIFGIILVLPFMLRAQNYNVLFIPDSLKKEANAILRCDNNELNIKSTKEVTYKNKFAITILNEDGLKYAQYREWTDKYIILNL